ncbi:MAG: hypothetical protein Ct9H300mP12_15800 [Acidimicrobiales bacterium]|nr:MAG: hypothetical protein Ct9H300mP12_15800 [Acidimicrobiales bacterium]
MRAPTPGPDPEGLPDIYIAMGQTAENVAEHKGCPVRLRTSGASAPRTC